MDFIVLNLGHAKTPRHWANKDISSPFIRIYYTKRGRAVLHLPSGDVETSPGHMYMVPSYVPHSYECYPGFEFYYLFIYQSMEGADNPFEKYDFPTEVRANEATQLLFENYCNLYPQLNFPTRDEEAFENHQAFRLYAEAYQQMAPYERMQLHGLVEILTSYFMKHSKPRAIVADERIAHLLSYIQTHLAEPISIDQLASEACLTPSHLIRAFRHTMGITPLQYVTRKKVQAAQSQLLTTTLPVVDVARQVGFSDVSYFIRLFKKHIGFTPMEYRLKLIG